MKLRNYTKVSLQTVNESIFRCVANNHYTDDVSDAHCVCVFLFCVKFCVLFLEQTMQHTYMHRVYEKFSPFFCWSYCFLLNWSKSMTEKSIGGDEAKDRSELFTLLVRQFWRVDFSQWWNSIWKVVHGNLMHRTAYTVGNGECAALQNVGNFNDICVSVKLSYHIPIQFGSILALHIKFSISILNRYRCSNFQISTAFNWPINLIRIAVPLQIIYTYLRS